MSQVRRSKRILESRENEYASREKKQYFDSVPMIGQVLQLPELCDKILGYLSARDLLSSSLVSKSWYLSIGMSRPFKKSIKIVMSSTDQKRSMGCLQKSKRNYRNLEVKVTAPGKEIKLMKWHSLASVKLCVRLDISKDLFLNYLKALAPTVTNLCFWGIDLDPSTISGSWSLFEFPRMETLYLGSKDIMEVTQPFLSRHRSLRSLCLHSCHAAMQIIPVEKDAPNNVITLIKLNPDIYHLSFQGQGYVSLFENPDFPQQLENLRLKSLSFRVFSCFHGSANVQGNLQCSNNLKRIIAYIGATLERIEFYRTTPQHFLIEIWNDCPKLNQINLQQQFSNADNAFRPFDVSHIQIQTNVNLKKLAIDVDESYKAMILKILKASPNLERLCLKFLTTDILLFASSNLAKLETIRALYGCSFCCRIALQGYIKTARIVLNPNIKVVISRQYEHDY